MEWLFDQVTQHYKTMVLSTGVIVLLHWTYHRGNKKYKLPPGPPNLPLVGSLPFIGKDFREPLRKMAKKYGDMMTIYIGARQTVYLNTYDVIKEAFVKHGHSFAGRPQDLFYLRDFCENIGIIASEGELWREQRHFTHKVLRDLGIGKIRLEPQIQEEIQAYLAALESANGAPMDPDAITRKAICNIIYTIVNGNRNDYADELYNRYLKDTNAANAAIRAAGPIVAFPFLRYLPGDLFSFKFLAKNREHDHGVMLKNILEHRESLDPANPRDFIDVYLIQMMEDQKENPNSTFSYPQLVQVVADMYGGGTDTSVNTLVWCLIYILHNPDVMKRCQAEIDDVIGPHRAPSMTDKSSMPYIEATLFEVARMASVVPYAVPHTNIEDVEFRGYIFPKGTNFMPNFYAVHYDPVTWPEPETFKPTRHLMAEGKLMKKEQLIPFSIGRRACLGESLARMNLFLFFTSILQKFDVALPEGEPLPVLVGELGATHAPPPYNVTFKHRT